MKATRYPSYKPGQSKNIPLLPEHWAELPLKRLFRLEKREPLDSDEIVTAFRDGTVTLRKNRREDGFTNALKEIGYQRIHRNDLVIHAMDAFAGAIGVSDSDGKSSPVYSACTARKDAIPHFYAYYLRDLALHGFIESLAKGIRERSTDFRWSDASMVAVPVPPASEQLAIANFLDRETAKIDALIAEQQRLIELLQEKRQAVISHAVTKGLNPNAPMKDSGVEWLGEVPEHWGVRRLRYIGTLQNGLNIGAEAFGEGDPFVSYGDVYNNPNIPSQPAGLVRSTPDDKRKYGLEKGDALFTRTSETVDDIGVASTCLEPVLHSTFAGFLIRLRPFQGVLEPRYSTHLFRNRGVKNHFAGTLNMVTRASLSQGELGDLPICIPPLEEQLEIAIYIEEMTEKSDHLISSARNLVSLLQERRSALISAAVTGQIDVRGLVPEAAEL